MHSKKRVLLLIGALAACMFCMEGGAHAYGKSTALGINYPGASLKTFLSDSFALEARGQYEKKILVGGGRLYWYPAFLGTEESRLRPFFAAEGDFITFEGTYSKGNGMAAGGFFGLEWFMSKRLSFQTDGGPVYIALEDKDTALLQSGLEYVVNFGINFYFK